MLSFRCPGCQASHQLPDKVQGRKFLCPSCKVKIKNFPDGRFEIYVKSGSPADDDPPEISLPAENGAWPPSAARGAEPRPAITPEALAGTVVGHYKLIGLIGSGTGGHVFLAEHQTLQRKMAVKILAAPPSLERTAKLAQEAVALAKVDHPNVVHVYDFWVDQGIPYIAMQLVDGPSLDQTLKQGPYDNDRLLRLARDLLAGLEFIHQAGILHRDIKPSNVLLSSDGSALLADFGLAWEAPNVAALPANIFSGTAEYAAPELAVGRPPDVRTDLYALGGTLYKAATGRVPFSGSSTSEKLRKQLYEPLVPPRSLNPKLAPEIEALLLKLLHKDREGRPASARDASQILGPVADPAARPKSTRRIVTVRKASSPLVPVLVASAVLLIALGVVAALAMRPRPAEVAQIQQRPPSVAVPLVPAAPATRDSGPKDDPVEQADLTRLNVILAGGNLEEAIASCDWFLDRHPKSLQCESVLLKKAELMQELAKLNKPVEKPVVVQPPLPPPEKPPSDPPPPIPPKKKSAGVLGRPLPTSVREALVWLARHQSETGRWDVLRHTQKCTGSAACTSRETGDTDYEVGITALALLAVMGSGIGMNAQDEYQGWNLGDTVREGVRCLVQIQMPNGRFGKDLPKQTYSQAFAIQALAEAVRSLSTGTAIQDDECKRMRQALERGVQYLLDVQNPGLGWRYGGRDNDTSVTAAGLLAFHAARRAGVPVPEAAFTGGLAWFQTATDKVERRVGYNAPGTGKVFIPGKNESYNDHPTMTAAAGLCRNLIAKDTMTALTGWARIVSKDPPSATLNAVDYYYWYYGTRFALVAFDGKDLEPWKSAVTKAVAAGQCTDNAVCRRGSWEPNDRWSSEGGRIYVTAINALTLEYLSNGRPFDFGPGAPGDAPAEGTTIQWIFKLRSGGRLQALSYEEVGEFYIAKIVGGSARVAKADVEQIQKADPKGK